MSSEGPYKASSLGVGDGWKVTGPRNFYTAFIPQDIAELLEASMNYAYLSGQRDERERCAKVAEGMKNGFTVDPVEGKMVRDKEGPWFLKSAIAAAIRASGNSAKA